MEDAALNVDKGSSDEDEDEDDEAAEDMEAFEESGMLDSDQASEVTDTRINSRLMSLPS